MYVNTVIYIFTYSFIYIYQISTFRYYNRYTLKKIILSKGTLLAKEKPSQVSVIVRKV